MYRAVVAHLEAHVDLSRVVVDRRRPHRWSVGSEAEFHEKAVDLLVLLLDVFSD